MGTAEVCATITHLPFRFHASPCFPYTILQTGRVRVYYFRTPISNLTLISCELLQIVDIGRALRWWYRVSLVYLKAIVAVSGVSNSTHFTIFVLKVESLRRGSFCRTPLEGVRIWRQ